MNTFDLTKTISFTRIRFAIYQNKTDGDKCDMDIQGSRQPSDVEQLKTRFEQVTDAFFEQTQRKLELSRALNDREAIVKEQIKIEVMKGAQAILEGCYREVISDTGD